MFDPGFNPPDCLAKSDVPRKVVEAVYEYIVETEYKGYIHDDMDRSGIFQKQTIFFKSIRFDQNCDRRGYVNANGKWVEDPKYPSVSVIAARAGPGRFTHTRVPVDPSICPIGSKCCMPKKVDHNNYTMSWFSFASSFQRMCSPMYKQTCDANGLTNCASVSSNDIRGKTSCNCLECDYNSRPCGAWAGAGVDCWDIIPGGAHYGKADYDMFKAFHWAAQKHFNEHDGWCGQPYDNDDMLEVCENTHEGACMIDYIPELVPDYTLFTYGGGV